MRAARIAHSVIVATRLQELLLGGLELSRVRLELRVL